MTIDEVFGKLLEIYSNLPPLEMQLDKLKGDILFDSLINVFKKCKNGELSVAEAKAKLLIYGDMQNPKALCKFLSERELTDFDYLAFSDVVNIFEINREKVRQFREIFDISKPEILQFADDVKKRQEDSLSGEDSILNYELRKLLFLLGYHNINPISSLVIEEDKYYVKCLRDYNGFGHHEIILAVATFSELATSNQQTVADLALRSLVQITDLINKTTGNLHFIQIANEFTIHAIESIIDIAALDFIESLDSKPKPDLAVSSFSC